MLHVYAQDFFSLNKINKYIRKSYNFWSFRTIFVQLSLFISDMTMNTFYLQIFKYLYTTIIYASYFSILFFCHLPRPSYAYTQNLFPSPLLFRSYFRVLLYSVLSISSSISLLLSFLLHLFS